MVTVHLALISLKRVFTQLPKKSKLRKPGEDNRTEEWRIQSLRPVH